MALAPIVSRFHQWRTQCLLSAQPLLVRIRADLSELQWQPDADGIIDRVEEEITSDLDAVLAEAGVHLQGLQEEIDSHLAGLERPGDEEYTAAEQIHAGATELRDRLMRKVASILAQARAQELLPIAQVLEPPSPPVIEDDVHPLPSSAVDAEWGVVAAPMAPAIVAVEPEPEAPLSWRLPETTPEQAVEAEPAPHWQPPSNEAQHSEPLSRSTVLGPAEFPAQEPIAGPRRFCTQCATRLTAEAWQLAQCPGCQAPL